MANYTVNLPKTSFPMRADLPKREPEILGFWAGLNIYKTFIKQDGGCEKFVLHDGPPYANGAIHLGHAFNKILKDIINKAKLLDGYSVHYVPGWDCHGLPIELNVEKKLGKAGVQISIEKFISECRKYANEQLEEQMQSFKRLGVVADWENRYATMDFKYEADIVRALVRIVENDYVVRGYKPVHWCVACGSALAEAEVEYKDKVSPAIDIRFFVVDPSKFSLSKLSIPIWTTTPWTLPANEAVCLHPEFKYVVVQCLRLKENFIVLEELLDTVMQRYGETEYKVVNSYFGKELNGILLKHPFLEDKVVPVILGTHVTTDAGTGAVHTAPAHGQEDYKVGLHYDLPIHNPVGPDGRFLSSTPFFAGEKVFAANDHVISILKEKGNLICATDLQHSYPHCWRHKTPLIFRATQQWFISMDHVPQNGEKKQSLRDQAFVEIDKVNWGEEQDKERIKRMVGLRPDWCISRQRVCGVPLALFVHKETGAIHPQMHYFIDKIIAPKVEQEGVNYWFKLSAQDFLREYAKDTVAEDYEKITDILDVWFDSGVTHFCVLQQNPQLQVPADLYVEGSDQYRGWFQSSLLTAIALYGHAPYKRVLSHGFTVDANGKKMSKSLGNVISPQQIIDKYGADVLRLWVASTYMHNDMAASTEIFARTSDAYRMIRNTIRFLLGNIFDFSLQEDLVNPEQMIEVDRWAVAQVLALEKTCIEFYNAYQFHSACAAIQSILTTEISNFYFSVIKDRLYTMAPKSLGRKSAQTASLHILEILVRIIAPVLSFTAEETWQELRRTEQDKGITTRKESVFMSGWYTYIQKNDFDLATAKVNLNDWNTIQTLRTLVNKELEKLRVAGFIGSSLAAEVTLYCDANIFAVLKQLGEEIRFILITSKVLVKDINEATAQAITTDLDGLKLEVVPSKHAKCARCWHYCESVGKNKEHQELCGRCIENLFGSGEERHFA